jgi:hypothetical protein
VSTDIKTTSAEFAEADPERLALHQKALELSKKKASATTLLSPAACN